MTTKLKELETENEGVLELATESESELNKYKERLAEYRKQNQTLIEQVEAFASTQDKDSGMTKVLERQQ
jgi:predicted nuclease with TOPRIM domain